MIDHARRRRRLLALTAGSTAASLTAAAALGPDAVALIRHTPDDFATLCVRACSLACVVATVALSLLAGDLLRRDLAGVLVPGRLPGPQRWLLAACGVAALSGVGLAVPAGAAEQPEGPGEHPTASAHIGEAAAAAADQVETLDPHRLVGLPLPERASGDDPVEPGAAGSTPPAADRPTAPAAVPAPPPPVPSSTRLSTSPAPAQTTAPEPSRSSTLPPPSDRVHPSPRRAVPSPARLEVTVAPGDSLWLLAERHAAPSEVGAYWVRLRELNSDRLGGSPDLLHPGQRLRLPHASTHPSAPSPATAPQEDR